MSVRAGERTQGDLTVIVKTKEMAIYTLRITNNEKNFPKRYRLSVVNKIQDKAFEKARYEKLKKYNEQRQRAKKRKQEVKNNGKVIKKPTERY